MKLNSIQQLQALPVETSQGLLLTFRDPDLEAAFRADAAQRTQRWHRVLWSVSTALWIALFFTDPYTAGDAQNLHVVRSMRLALGIPAGLIATAVGFASAATYARWRILTTVVAIGVHFAFIVCIGLYIPHPEHIVAPGNLMALGTLLFGACMLCAMLRLPFASYATLFVVLLGALGLVNRRFPLFAAADVRIWFVISIVIGLFVAWQLERSWRDAFLTHRLLDEERGRGELLLRSVLPLRIAERLKHDRRRIAERHEEVTVLFADLVGFTTLSVRMSAEDIVAKLDDIFSRFDDIAQRHGLEKIKTIGDAYMVVSGVPLARPDHAHAIVAMALEMLAYVDGLEVDGTKLGMRVGVHSGPVVAGVIGKQKFTFDVWGGTVNVASRMESHGLPGCIQITAATKAALGDAFPIAPRGTVDVKGVGPMQTWLVTR